MSTSRLNMANLLWSPPEGQTATPEDPSASGSKLTETTGSDKAGAGRAPLGTNPTNLPLDRVRVDSSDQRLTTNQGVPIADNQNSLKAGYRGPALLQDFILREKITHFDHERIPERIVHARGSAAHGYFECYESLEKYTAASLFAEAGKRTPVFVRFSTVIGERGSADTVRDVRGFAVKFYTDEGNWDLVGNNIPVFFIQDAMKFPDLVHAAKPEPHFAVPQASTAHDTFWDFISLMPESTHMILWAMSDRAIPRSYRMMQGFGVHTFRLVNENGESRFVKFHWRPLAGTHSLDWDEAVKIAGADADYHRRDLWEAIESGAYPEYEFGMQIFTEEEAAKFSFDVLDSTKIVPEELVPIMPVGKMVLNRNPDKPRILCLGWIFLTILCWLVEYTLIKTRRYHGSADLTFMRFPLMHRSHRRITTSAKECTVRQLIGAGSHTNLTHSEAAALFRQAQPVSLRFQSL
jgi:catalase